MVIDENIIHWLLDSDPSIRWQVKKDLLQESEDQVFQERSKVATEGWGAKLLSQQLEDGTWSGVEFNQELNSTMHVLTLLRELGLDPNCKQANKAINLVHEKVFWRGWDWDGSWKGIDFVGNPFFSGEVEPCINGQVGASGAYFGQDITRIINRLLQEQLQDGGWNCDAPDNSKKSSFNTTICVLEALLEYERSKGENSKVKDARLRGEEYLLERQLFFRKSTGVMITQDRKSGNFAWTKLTFPTWWYYDVLRALEYFRIAGFNPDERFAKAIDLILSKQTEEGKWLLEVIHPGKKAIDFGEKENQPSRWVTLQALRVLQWYESK